METKLKFKVGDRVRVKSLEWYNSSKGAKGNILSSEIAGVDFVKGMDIFCGQVSQIQEVSGNYYIMQDCGCYCWQDWMLEDEIFTEDDPVTEVKQEIEQPKKTRVLTKEVAQAIVRCTKYRLKNKNESTQLQEKLFEIGCEWESGCKEVLYDDCKFIYVNKYLKIQMGGEEDDDSYYINEPSAAMSVNDVLNIEIKETYMETKELKKQMTQQEVLEYLNNTKILCTSTEETAKVQQKLFELGLEWKFEGVNLRKDKYLLFIDDRRIIGYTSDIIYWIENKNRQIEPSEILAIQLKEEKPKFDPKTLKPFDKVLVRNSVTNEWHARFFDIYNQGLYETASGEYWTFCIPYNEETEHLHETTEEAPEFYRG